jgi:hypothetical protein
VGNWASSAIALPVIDFDGDKIAVTVNRLKVKSMSLIAGKYSNGTLTFANQMELCEVASQLLPEYIVSVSGMTKADGSQFSRDDLVAVLGEFYFAQLVGAILNGLIEASSVREAGK